MRIDKSQRGWAIASLIILAGSTTAYVFSAHESPRGATGGSPLGLLFGSIGFGFMIFAVRWVSAKARQKIVCAPADLPRCGPLRLLQEARDPELRSLLQQKF